MFNKRTKQNQNKNILLKNEINKEGTEIKIKIITDLDNDTY